jgi:hypothetical protein
LRFTLREPNFGLPAPVWARATYFRIKHLEQKMPKGITWGAVLTLAGAIFGLCGGEAQARCDKVGLNKYDPAKGLGSDFFYVTDNGSCSVTHSIVSGQGAYQYTESRVLEPAKSGTVKYTSLTRWRYVANPGFIGRDTFKLRVCAESTVGKGCAVLNYDIQIKRS